MNGFVTLYMIEDCLSEIGEVLRRPVIREIFPMLDEDRTGALLDWIREYAVFIDPIPTVFEYPTDVKDEPYINLAIESGAVYLVSWDKHIRNLGKPDHPEGQRFQMQFPQVLVLNPSEFLSHYRRAMQSSHDQN